jgi:predicted lysophospholipase L1 biosynthesis ABC-type transport system permease subunit
MSDGKYAIIAIIAGVIAAVLAFIITWKISNFFIPPRYNWSKSAYTVFIIKLGMAGTAAFYAFIGVMGLIVAMR